MLILIGVPGVPDAITYQSVNHWPQTWSQSIYVEGGSSTYILSKAHKDNPRFPSYLLQSA